MLRNTYLAAPGLSCSMQDRRSSLQNSGSAFLFCFFFQLQHSGSLVGARKLSCGMWDLVLTQGLNPHSLHWELGVLATWLPGKSQDGKFYVKCISPRFTRNNAGQKVIRKGPVKISTSSPDKPEWAIHEWSVVFRDTHLRSRPSYPQASWQGSCNFC